MPDIYDTPRLLSEYLLFHYGRDEDVLPWESGPREALGFAVRSVEKLTDPSQRRSRALDLGCAVGRSSFTLSAFCDDVTGIDWSQQFVDAAEHLRNGDKLSYSCHEEAGRYRSLTAECPSGAHPDRIRFARGDAMNLPDDIGAFDLVHAANLLCRLTDPLRLIQRLPSLVLPGGELLLTTPCTWLEEFTPPERWPRGSTIDWLTESLSPHFRLTRRLDLPFLIREHARKYQWTVALGTAWRRIG